MPKRIRKGLLPVIRGIVRAGVREGKTKLDIHERITEKFGERTVSTIDRIISQETRRQNAVSSIMGHKLRDKVDIRKLTGCTDKDSRVMAYITLVWDSEKKGMRRASGVLVELESGNRLQDVLNSALRSVTRILREMGSDPPTITSSMRSGSAHYRIEYVECT